jgi:hypothetical protein
MNKRRTYVHLTGGLGNQLFQLAAALSYRKNSIVVFENNLGSPRLNKKGHPDLFDFDLRGIDFVVNKNGFLNKSFVSRASNFMLRSGVAPTRFEKYRIFNFCFLSAATLILSINFLRPMQLSIGQGLGFFDRRRNGKLSNYQIGYFQSYKWASKPDVFERLMEISPKNPSEIFLSSLEEVKSQSPIVVHLRLGDYKNENGFGIPDIKYYVQAIQMLQSQIPGTPIWYFSDEPELAKNYLKNNCPEGLWFSKDLSNSCELLEIMRHGAGYVIGNSTFSWWGAFLRRNQGAPVTAPNPWFRTASPVALVPQNWIEIDSGIQANDKVWE